MPRPKADAPYSAGQKGLNRVRMFRHRTGVWMCEYTLEGKKVRESLQTESRPEAKTRLEAVSETLRAQRNAPVAPQPASDGSEPRSEMTLELLLRDFRTWRNRPHAKKKLTKARRDEEGRFERHLLEHFPADLKVADIDVTHLEAYTAWRRTHGDRRWQGKNPDASTPTARPGRDIGHRVIQQEIKWLLRALLWAVGINRIPVHPLCIYRVEGTPDPLRPRLDEQDYRRLLAEAASVGTQYVHEEKTLTALKVALVVADGTGHRRNAIRLLQWQDIDFVKEEVTWRKATDKIAHTHTTPLEAEALETLQAWHHVQGNPLKGYVFASHGRWGTGETKPIAKETLTQWFRQAKERAGLMGAKYESLGFHALRRKFASDHRETPRRILMDLGGWKSSQTIENCYQESSAEAKREGMKFRKRGLSGDD